jgi:uncharacterized protein YggE
MNRNTPKVIFFTFFCLLLFAPTIWAADVTTVTIQGTSHMEVAPDQAIVTLGIVSSAVSAETARNSNAAISAAVQQKLMTLNLTKEQIKTSQFMVYPEYNSDSDKSGKPPIIIGYRISNNITVTIDDVSLVGNVIDASLAAGANQIIGVRFQKKSDTELKQALLVGAVQDALSKANSIATALDKHFKRVVSVNEESIGFQQPDSPRFNMLLKSDASNSNATSLSPGMIIANASIAVVCELQ